MIFADLPITPAPTAQQSLTVTAKAFVGALGFVSLPIIYWAWRSIISLTDSLLEPSLPEVSKTVDPVNLISYQIQELGKEKLRIEHRIGLTSAICVLFALIALAMTVIVPGYPVIGAASLSGMSGVIATFLVAHSRRLSKDIGDLVNQLDAVREQDDKARVRAALALAIEGSATNLSPAELIDAIEIAMPEKKRLHAPQSAGEIRISAKKKRRMAVQPNAATEQSDEEDSPRLRRGAHA